MRNVVWGLVALVALGLGLVGGQLLSGAQGSGDASDSEAEAKAQANAELIAQLEARLGELERRVASLQRELKELKAKAKDRDAPAAAPSAPSAPPAPWRIGFVRVNPLALRYQEGNEELRRQFQDKIQELQQQAQEVQRRLQAGEIEPAEAQFQLLQLQQELQRAVAELIAMPLQLAINQVAQEKGYDLVLKREDVVLYSKEGILDDLTEAVWEVLQTMR